MSSMIEFFNTTVSPLLLPIAVATALLAFKSIARRSVENATIIRRIEADGNDRPTATENIKILIEREDVTLRVLEEVLRAGPSRYLSIAPDIDAKRILALGKIQSILRNVMTDAVKSDNFPVIRDRLIRLIDEARREIELLQEKKPFDGLQEPEKSLLVDMLNELPNDKPIPRQKALQLADIIRLKHQDILKLQQENAKSAAWTRWGTYGTVFFGILSIVLSFYTSVK